MKALIISGGNFPKKELLFKELEYCDILIGVDKGIELLDKFKIKPHLIVGDFDSVNKEVLQKYLNEGTEIIKFPPEKDFTDTHLAISKCIELNVSNITMLGCIGSRMDHTLGNIGLLYYCLVNDIKAYIKDDHNTIFMIDKDTILNKSGKSFFSLAAYGGEVEGLSIINAKYPLKDYNLKPWESISISNEFIDKDVTIKLKSGILIVTYGKD